MKHISRFFISSELKERSLLTLSNEQCHHAFDVLRMKEDEIVYAFNSEYGEWECKIFDVRKGKIECIRRIRESKKEDGPVLACAIISPNNMSWMLEKVTELGVSEIIPIVTQYTTQHQKFNEAKAEKVIIQACEQCKRLTIPKLHCPIKLVEFLKEYNFEGPLLVGDEKFPKNFLYDFVERKSVFLIGPEGGFSESEHELFGKYPFVKKIKISNNILRTETAAITCIATWGCKFF